MGEHMRMAKSARERGLHERLARRGQDRVVVTRPLPAIDGRVAASSRWSVMEPPSRSRSTSWAERVGGEGNGRMMQHGTQRHEIMKSLTSPAVGQAVTSPDIDWLSVWDASQSRQDGGLLLIPR